MINITIQSLNNKTIDVTNLDTFSKIYTNISNNQTINSSYSNLIIDIKTSTTSLSIPNFFNNLKSINSDVSFFFVFVISVFLVWMLIKLVKRLE